MKTASSPAPSFDDVLSAALTKIPSKAVMLKVGEHEVDFVVRIHGSLTQGEKYQQRIVPKANLDKLVLLLLSKLNSTTADSIAELVLEAERIGDDILTAEMKKIKTYADEAMLKIKATTWTDCKGKLSADINAELISVTTEAFKPPEKKAE